MLIRGLQHGTMILTDNGYRNVHDLKKDDVVLLFENRTQELEKAKVKFVVQTGEKYGISTTVGGRCISVGPGTLLKTAECEREIWRHCYDLTLSHMVCLYTCGELAWKTPDAIVGHIIGGSYDLSITTPDSAHYWVIANGVLIREGTVADE